MVPNSCLRQLMACVLLVALLAVPSIGQQPGDAFSDPRELPLPQVVPGKLTHMQPREAFQFLSERLDALFIDVRQEVEYSYVGHPLGSELIAWVEYPQTVADDSSREKFLEAVLRRVDNQKDVPLVLICRSGKRTIEAGDALIDAGFTSVISVVEGFEGDPDENRHRSTRGGWRFAGLPWEQD